MGHLGCFQPHFLHLQKGINIFFTELLHRTNEVVNRKMAWKKCVEQHECELVIVVIEAKIRERTW